MASRQQVITPSAFLQRSLLSGEKELRASRVRDTRQYCTRGPKSEHSAGHPHLRVGSGRFSGPPLEACRAWKLHSRRLCCRVSQGAKGLQVENGRDRALGPKVASCELLWFPKAHPGGYWFHLQSTLLSWESRRSLAQGSGPWQSEAGLESGGRWSQVVTRPSPCSLGPLGLSGPSCLHNKGPEEGPTVPPSTWVVRSWKKRQLMKGDCTKGFPEQTMAPRPSKGSD